MSASRALVPAEVMVDVFDRASTMNFTTILSLRGPLEAPALEAALRDVARRHPLLRARIDRSKGLRFVADEAAPIALRWVEAPETDVDAYAAETLTHRAWPDAGPRAEVTLMRHGPLRATMLLTLHHIVSDGSSGVIVSRDILRALAGTLPDGEVVSPGQNAFFPAGRGGGRDLGRALVAMAKASAVKPYRLKPHKNVSPSERRVRLFSVDLDAEQTARLVTRAKRASSTAHGVLVGALGRALAAEGAGARPLRVLHPVDFRRMLDGKSDTPAIGDAVGYYVSSVETDFFVKEGESLESLAQTITTSVHAKKANGEPFLSAPSAGKLAIALGSMLGIEGFRKQAERNLIINSFALTNLGRLENLGLEKDVGALTVTHAGFVAAGSVVGTLFASAATFDGALCFRIGACEPTIAPEVAARIAERVRNDLAAFCA
jgi:NRPS condensation-like uncharacterized protein